jgi:hypothetical protein
LYRVAGDPQSDSLQLNAVNVQFLNPSFGRNTRRLQVSIDIVYDDEQTANAKVDAVWVLLSSAFYTPLLNYANPLVPVAAGGNLTWPHNYIEFRKIINNNYTHYSGVFTLTY